MLAASRANILKPNLNSTAIANHNPYLFLSYSLYRYSTARSLNVKEKKIGEKIIFYGMIFALAQHLLHLPFWQLARAICHFGSFAGYSPSCQADRIGCYSNITPPLHNVHYNYCYHHK
jgi:hypothetical protein